VFIQERAIKVAEIWTILSWLLGGGGGGGGCWVGKGISKYGQHWVEVGEGGHLGTKKRG